MNFKNWLEQYARPIDQIVQDLRNRFPGLVLWASEHDNRINVGEIVVPAEQRSQGIGSEVLNTIKQYAQSVGKPVTLSPEPSKGKKGALDKFYKKNGFVWNKGRNKDYSLASFFGSNMVWRPEKRIS
jgi:GNAT superfamily N-acetyltransferase